MYSLYKNLRFVILSRKSRNYAEFLFFTRYFSKLHFNVILLSRLGLSVFFF